MTNRAGPRSGQTPLHNALEINGPWETAREGGLFETLELLLSSGAVRSAVDDRGRTPRDLLEEGKSIFTGDPQDQLTFAELVAALEGR